MKTNKAKGSDGRRGAVLVVVMGLALLGSLAASSVAFSVGSRVRQTRKQVALEQAFYLAEAGAERAASYVGTGNTGSTTLEGSLAQGTYAAAIDSRSLTGGAFQFDITSVGTVDGVSRTVTMRGVQRVSWARYALWYDEENPQGLWMVPGEKFRGRFYSWPLLRFHDLGLSDKPPKDQVRFYDRAWTGESYYEVASSKVKPIFDYGLTYNAERQDMVSVDFGELNAQASAGYVFEGPTTNVINGKTMTVTNGRLGWKNKVVPVPSDGLVYVKTVKSGKTYSGDLTVSAPSGLGDRLTLVAERDITIANHVRYENNPANNPSSTDALGLIAKRHVWVGTSAPQNLEIYAHIIAQEGGFGVTDYDKGSSRGKLTVYGGIVNKIRNAVGIVGGAGYVKNYIFDERFSNNPPPHYPRRDNDLEWSAWEG
jgi:hypothetical protein